VKLGEKHICGFTVMLAFLLAFGNTVFANNLGPFKVKTAAIDTLQADNHSEPIVFIENSSVEVSQFVSQIEPLVFGVSGSIKNPYNFSEIKISAVAASFYSQKDKRKLIFQHIFPYHFFW
jgi:hypothetical protein